MLALDAWVVFDQDQHACKQQGDVPFRCCVPTWAIYGQVLSRPAHCEAINTQSGLAHAHGHALAVFATGAYAAV